MRHLLSPRLARLGLPLFAALATAPALAAPAPAEAAMKEMLAAIKEGSHDAFLAPCDDKMKVAITKQMFEGVAAQVGPKMKKGYTTTALGELRKKDDVVSYLWKLEFSGMKDDMLIRMAVAKDGRVAGFFIQ